MPIDQTMRGLALEINAAADPTASETQPLLEYRFINSANFQTILARIRGAARPAGGGQLAFETNGGADTTIQRMLIDDQGNVGIGTASPGTKLDVAGDARMDGDCHVMGKLTAASFAGDGSGLSNIAPADGSITSGKLAEDAASFSKVSGGKIAISADNVGIGTENPSAKLDVAGDAKFQSSLSVQGGLTASGLEINGGAKIDADLSVTGKLTAASFAGDGSGLSNVTAADGSITSAKLAEDAASFSKVTGAKMVIRGDNIGIGTANPRARLEVAGDTKFDGALNVQGALTVRGAVKINGDLSVTGKLTAASFSGNGAGLTHVTAADNSISSAKLSKDAASLGKITGGAIAISGGNVTVSGTTKTNKLQLGEKWLLSGVGDTHANDEWLRLYPTKPRREEYYGGFAAGKLYSKTGTVQGSDRRLKTEISSLESVIDKLLALRGVRFKWRDSSYGDSYRLGVIAQEVESVFPEVVETGPDGMKGINESGLIAAIITAIKEQQAELRALRAEIAPLRAI